MDRDTLHALAVANANWNGMERLIDVSGSERIFYPIILDSTDIYTMEWLGTSGSATLYQDSYTHVFCKYCRVKNHKDNSFCDGCGAPL